MTCFETNFEEKEYLLPKPRILALDLETFPNVAYVWGAYEQNAIEMKEDWYVLSYAAKWIGGGGGVVCRGLDDVGGQKKGMPNNDYRLMKEIHALMDEADIIVAHNGVDFDVKVANARFITHGFTPPSPYKVVDTKRAIKQVARFSSNKLDWLCRQLGLGRKLKHEGFPLWAGCAAGDEAAWRKMKRYNRHDVKLLESLYKLISPWIRQPNMALFMGNERCTSPTCGSSSIQARGVYRSKTRTYQRFVCVKCGTWSRAVMSEKSPKATVVSV